MVHLPARVRRASRIALLSLGLCAALLACASAPDTPEAPSPDSVQQARETEQHLNETAASVDALSDEVQSLTQRVNLLEESLSDVRGRLDAALGAAQEEPTQALEDRMSEVFERLTDLESLIEELIFAQAAFGAGELADDELAPAELRPDEVLPDERSPDERSPDELRPSGDTLPELSTPPGDASAEESLPELRPSGPDLQQQSADSRASVSERLRTERVWPIRTPSLQSSDADRNPLSPEFVSVDEVRPLTEGIVRANLIALDGVSAVFDPELSGFRYMPTRNRSINLTVERSEGGAGEAAGDAVPVEFTTYPFVIGAGADARMFLSLSLYYPVEQEPLLLESVVWNAGGEQYAFSPLNGQLVRARNGDWRLESLVVPVRGDVFAVIESLVLENEAAVLIRTAAAAFNVRLGREESAAAFRMLIAYRDLGGRF